MLLLLLVTTSITLPPSEGVDMTVLDYREVTIYNAFYGVGQVFLALRAVKFVSAVRQLIFVIFI
jgi:hypothetical protein